MQNWSIWSRNNNHAQNWSDRSCWIIPVFGTRGKGASNNTWASRWLLTFEYTCAGLEQSIETDHTVQYRYLGRDILSLHPQSGGRNALISQRGRPSPRHRTLKSHIQPQPSKLMVIGYQCRFIDNAKVHISANLLLTRGWLGRYKSRQFF